MREVLWRIGDGETIKHGGKERINGHNSLKNKGYLKYWKWMGPNYRNAIQFFCVNKSPENGVVGLAQFSRFLSHS